MGCLSAAVPSLREEVEMGRLTDLQALTLTRPGLHGDGDTLYLKVSPRGSKSWVQRIWIKGRRHAQDAARGWRALSSSTTRAMTAS